MIISRNFDRSEEDDFKLSVTQYLSKNTWAVPIVYEGQLTGWKLIGAYE